MQFTLVVSFIAAFAHAVYAQPVVTAVEVSSPNFRLMGNLDKGEAQDLVQDLEEFRGVILDVMNAPNTVETRKVTINYIADVKEFYEVAPASNISAFYFQSILGPRILINGRALQGDPEQIRRALFHEYMHHLNHYYLGYKIPVWLNEGLAEYYATFEETEQGSFKVGQNLDDYFQALDTGGWTPLTVLFDALHEYPYLKTSRGRQNARSQSYFYAQSWAIVHYVQNLPDGRDKLQEFVKALDPLMNSEDAFMAIFDMSYLEFEEVLKAYIKSQSMASDVITSNRNTSEAKLTVKTISSYKLLAERYLVSSLLNEYDGTDEFLVSTREELRQAERSFAALHIANVTNAMQSNNYIAANRYLRDAKSAFPKNKNLKFLEAILTFASITEYTEQSLSNVRSKLEAAIRDNPDDLQLRVYLISTYPPESSQKNQSLQSHLSYLVEAKFEVRNPEFVTAIVPYLEVAKLHAVSDRTLRTAEVWLSERDQRSKAYRMRVGLTFSRPDE